MNNIVLSDEQRLALRRVLDYVMSSEADFFEDELASFGDEEAKRCVGYIAWKLAQDLGLSSPNWDYTYNQTAAEFGFIEEDDV